MVRAIEPKPAGRPSLVVTEAEQIRALRERVQELERALLESQVREEIALVLPNVQRAAQDDETVATVEKKMRSPRVKIRKPR